MTTWTYTNIQILKQNSAYGDLYFCCIHMIFMQRPTLSRHVLTVYTYAFMHKVPQGWSLCATIADQLQWWTATPNNTHNSHLIAFFPGQARWAGTRRINYSGFFWSRDDRGGSGISWNICKSFAPWSRQNNHAITSSLKFSHGLDAIPAAQLTASK